MNQKTQDALATITPLKIMEMHMPTWPTQIGCICEKLAPAALLKTGMLFVPKLLVAQQGLTPCGKARRATPPR